MIKNRFYSHIKKIHFPKKFKKTVVNISKNLFDSENIENEAHSKLNNMADLSTDFQFFEQESINTNFPEDN